MDEPQLSQSGLAPTLQLGNEDAAVIADNHMMQLAPTIGQDAHLTAQVMGQLTELASKFGTVQPICGEPPPKQSAQAIELGGLQPFKGTTEINTRPPGKNGRTGTTGKTGGQPFRQRRISRPSAGPAISSDFG